MKYYLLNDILNLIYHVKRRVSIIET